MKLINHITKKSRNLQRFCGVNFEQFKLLSKNLQKIWAREKIKKRKDKSYKRRSGGGRKASLETMDEKLIVVLFYYKMYVTQDLLAMLTRVDQSTISRTISKLTPVLEEAADPRLKRFLGEALKRQPCLRKMGDWFDFFGQFPELEEVLSDATEQQCLRPRDNIQKKSYYSGKRKRHTLKTQITVSSESKRVLDVSLTYPGSVHDKKVFDTEKTIKKIPLRSRHFVDRGYDGAQRENPDSNILIPFKKKPKQQLHPILKSINKHHSRKRIPVEHILGKIKNFKICSSIFRGKKENYNCIFRNVAALYNFALSEAI